MTAIPFREQGIEAAKVARLLAGLERIPPLRLAVLDDRAGACQIVLVEEDAGTHVEKIAQAGAGIGSRRDLGNPLRHGRRDIEDAAVDEDADDEA